MGSRADITVVVIVNEGVVRVEEKPNYYAVIPASIRYDNELPQGAKLLYGEITALANQEGYCYASNAYFSKLYEKSERTIKDWISKLVDRGFLSRRVVYKDGTKEVSQRRLYLQNVIIGNLPLQSALPSEENCPTPCENLPLPGEEDCPDNNTSLILQDNIKHMFNAYTTNQELIDTLNDFVDARKKMKKTPTENAISRLLKKLDKIAANDVEKVTIIEESIINGWSGVFPLKNKVGEKNEVKPTTVVGADGIKRDALGSRIY